MKLHFRSLCAGLFALSSTLLAAPVPPDFTQVANEVLGPGVTYQKFVRTGASPLVVYVTEADLTDSRVQVRGVTAYDIYAAGRKSVQSIARQQAEKGTGAVVAAVNGDYFDFTTNGTTSASVHNSQVVRGGISSAIRSTFVLTESREVSFGVNYVSGGTVLSLATNQSNPLHGANTGRAANQFILYTPYYGSTVASPAATDVRDILLKPLGPSRINAPVDYEVVSILSGGGSIAVPPGHYLLSASSGLKTWVEANLIVGQQVRITAQLSSETRPVAQMIGGGPRLLTAGAYSYPDDFNLAENVSHAFQLAARTAVGVTAARKLQLVVVDRSTDSGGATLTQLADLMLALGSTDAMNLDGGGSSTMIAGADYALRNLPSDGSQRLVANAIAVETEIPLAQRVADIAIEPSFVELSVGGSRQVQAYAIDQAGVRFPIAGSELSWSVGGVGSVSNAGLVSSAGSGYGVLKASGFGRDRGAIISTGNAVTPWGWRKSAADGTLSAWTWFSTTNSYARGLAIGTIDGAPRLAIMNRSSNFLIGDIAEDATLTEVARGGITGGTYTTNDAEISSDGVLFAANLTTNATTAGLEFRVYQWSSGPSTAPVRVINYNGSALRLGDKITLVGSVADRTATLYAPASAPNAGTANTVLRWVINADGSWPATPDIITLAGVTNKGTQVDVAPVAPGAAANFWVKGNGFTATLHSSTGALLGELDSSLLPLASNALAYLEFGGRSYLAAYLQGAGQENARVLDLTNGIAGASVVFTTAPLGTNANTAGISGDVAWLVRADQSEAVLAVLATNNGVQLIGLPNPSLRKPRAVIAASTRATLAPPYAGAEFWVAFEETFSSARSIPVSLSGDAGLSVPSVTLPAGSLFARVPLSGSPLATTGPLTVTGTLGENAAWTIAGSPSAQLTLEIPAIQDPWDGWLAAEFTASELADSAISGPSADPFRVGLPNLVRYALGLTRASTAAEIQAARPRAGSANGFLKLSYLRPVGGQLGVSYVVEGSSDLATWETIAGGETITATADPEIERVEVTDTRSLSTQPRRFLRLRVVR